MLESEMGERYYDDCPWVARSMMQAARKDWRLEK